MPDKQWKKGDVVRLASGGPAMTVFMADNGHGATRAVWFSTLKEQIEYADFPADALVAAEPDGLWDAVTRYRTMYQKVKP